MYAPGSELVDPVPLGRLAQDPVHRTLVELRAVAEADPLAVARQRRVIPGHDGGEFRDELLPLLPKRRGERAKLRVEDLDQLLESGRLLPFEQLVALGQQPVVPHQRREIFAVELGDEAVEVFAALLARLVDQRRVGRRDQNQRNQADVVRQLLVLLAVAAKLLLASFLERAYDTLGAICRRLAVATVHEERLAAVPHALGVGQAEGALAHRKVVDRVEQIRLAGPVVADHAVDLRRELDLGLADVLEVDQGKSLKVHVGTESVAGGNPPATAIKGRHFFGNVQGRSLLRSSRGPSSSDGGRTGRAEEPASKNNDKKGRNSFIFAKKSYFCISVCLSL